MLWYLPLKHHDILSFCKAQNMVIKNEGWLLIIYFFRMIEE